MLTVGDTVKHNASYTAGFCNGTLNSVVVHVVVVGAVVVIVGVSALNFYHVPDHLASLSVHIQTVALSPCEFYITENIVFRSFTVL